MPITAGQLPSAVPVYIYESGNPIRCAARSPRTWRRRSSGPARTPADRRRVRHQRRRFLAGDHAVSVSLAGKKLKAAGYTWHGTDGLTVASGTTQANLLPFPALQRQQWHGGPAYSSSSPIRRYWPTRPSTRFSSSTSISTTPPKGPRKRSVRCHGRGAGHRQHRPGVVNASGLYAIPGPIESRARRAVRRSAGPSTTKPT